MSRRSRTATAAIVSVAPPGKCDAARNNAFPAVREAVEGVQSEGGREELASRERDLREGGPFDEERGGMMRGRNVPLAGKFLATSEMRLFWQARRDVISGRGRAKLSCRT